MATFDDYDLDDLARMGQSKKLKEHHTELGDQASSILERATTQKRDLNDAEFSEFNSISKELRDNKKRIEYANEQSSKTASVSASYDSQEFYSPQWRAIKEGRPTRFSLPVWQRLESMSLKARGSFESRDLTTSNV